MTIIDRTYAPPFDLFYARASLETFTARTTPASPLGLGFPALALADQFTMGGPSAFPTASLPWPSLSGYASGNTGALGGWGGLEGLGGGHGAYTSALSGLAQVMQQLLFIRAQSAQGRFSFDPGRATSQGGANFGQGDAIWKSGDAEAIAKYGKEKLNLEWPSEPSSAEMQTVGKFLDKIKGARADITPTFPGAPGSSATPGAAGGGKIDFTPAEAQRIQRATALGGHEAGKQEVLKIFSEKTGEPIFDDPQELDKEYSSRLHKYDVATKYDHLTDEQLAKRDVMTSNTRALNKLFGTTVPANEDYDYHETDAEGRRVEKVGHGNKRGLSTAVLSDLADNVVRGLEQSGPRASIHSSFTESFFGAQVPGWLFGGSLTASSCFSMPAPSTGFSVDATSYLDGIKHISELSTPLVFDLDGGGFKIGDSELVAFDVDADGKEELISDVKRLGILVLGAGEPGAALGAGNLFGRHTDLLAHGVPGSEERVYDDGFQALAALVEGLGLVTATKRHLDAADLAHLEARVGLRMRVGGLLSGRDLRFAELGITRIDLGTAEGTQSLTEAEADQWRNRAMRQQGATFVRGGRTLPYADLWFNVQARVVEAVEVPAEAAAPALVVRRPALALRA